MRSFFIRMPLFFYLSLFPFCCVTAATSLPLTTQQTLSIPFSYFENLYLDADRNSFVAIGNEVNPDLSIIPVGRGYSFWKSETLNKSRQEMTFLDGTTWFLLEHPGTSGYLNHFFHLLEHVVGTWSLYAHDHPGAIKRIVMGSDGHNHGAPWEGANFTNYHLITALFPNVEVMRWAAFVDKYRHQWLWMERAIVSDRASANHSPGCGKLNKMLGGALPDLSKTALDDMAKRVNDYAGTRENNRQQISITYLKRFNSNRALDDRLEDRLLAEICKIPNISLTYHWFEFLSFQEQINIIGNTDVLISVHGNGLSHILFLPPDTAAVEIYPADAHTLDYRIFADARQIDFLGVMCNRGVIPQDLAYEMGPFGNPNTIIYDMDLEPILAFIKKHQTLKYPKALP